MRCHICDSRDHKDFECTEKYCEICEKVDCSACRYADCLCSRYGMVVAWDDLCHLAQNIDWQRVPARLGSHKREIVRLIKNPALSVFRQELEGRVRRGEGRRPRDLLERPQDATSPGYYGPYGLEVAVQVL